MYDVELSKKAKQDLNEIIDYIAYDLSSPATAIEWADDFERTLEKRLELFPYAYPVHAFLESLGIEYRRTIKGNFTAFYKIIEKEKSVIITYIVYNSRDVEKIIIQD